MNNKLFGIKVIAYTDENFAKKIDFILYILKICIRIYAFVLSLFKILYLNFKTALLAFSNPTHHCRGKPK